MNIEELYYYCLSFPQAYESMPFGENVVVFKVNNKIFAIFNLNGDPLRLSCKIIPDRNIELQELYHSVTGGYHLNKKHWVTITLNEDLPDSEVKKIIKDSYGLILKTKKKRL